MYQQLDILFRNETLAGSPKAAAQQTPPQGWHHSAGTQRIAVENSSNRFRLLQLPVLARTHRLLLTVNTNLR